MKVLMFSRARALKPSSLPVLRMLSPQQLSSGPRIPKSTPALLEDLGGGHRHLLHPRVVAVVAADEVQELHALGEGLAPTSPSAQASRLARSSPSGLPSVASEAAAAVRTAATESGNTPYFVAMRRSDDADLDLPDAPGALRRAHAAGRAAPHLVELDLGQAEGGLADDLADAEVADPVPRADDVALAALVAEPGGRPAGLLDLAR